MSKEESKLLNKSVDGQLISPVLPEDIKNYLIDIEFAHKKNCKFLKDY